MLSIQNYINGTFASAASGSYINNFQPATGQLFTLVPDSDPRDVEQAVSAAQAAKAAWAALPPAQRARILENIAQLIHKNAEDLAVAESQDTGKPLSLTKKMDIPRAAQNFEFYAAACLHFASQSYHSPQILNYTLQQPLGIVGCISPWNLPLYLLTWKIAPALAAGNCVIAKPSEITPLTAFLLAEICQQAGLPAGVLNIIQGYGPKVGKAIVEHPAIKAISFTGSTVTGAEIARLAAPSFKKLSLEMGGKNPTIIFEDADYPEALQTAHKAAFTNQGQICLCGSRIFVHKKIYQKFKKDFVGLAQTLKIGPPEDMQTDIGAVSSQAHYQKILHYIELAKQEGGHILTGGHALALEGGYEEGYFIAPTVIEGLAHDCATNQEEIFGPVVTLTSFEKEQEVIAYANSVRYGLSASLWTQDLSRAHRIAAEIEAGVVWINCWLVRDLRTPFGGMKDSGLGREGGFETMDFFSEKKNICIKY